MKMTALMMLAATITTADLSGQELPDVVLLDFTASYCQPCQQMVPILDRMEKDSFPVRRVDITKQPSLSRQFKVDRIPTLILLVEGQERKRFVGLTAEEELRRVMNDAARKLEMSRRPEPQGTLVESNAEPATDQAQPAAVATESEQLSGLTGMFARMRNALSGSDAKKERFEFPTFRGQSPDDIQEPHLQHPNTMQASVRVRVTDGRVQDFGTGSIIHSSAGLSTVLTCAHLFQDVGKDAIVKIDVFRDGRTFTYPATVKGGNHNSDLAVLQFKSSTAMPTVDVAEAGSVKPQDKAFSIGCSNGAMPTVMTTEVVTTNRYQGPANLQCTKDPVRGRSGGGLFNENGQLIGVCSAADRESHEGLYMAVAAVNDLVSDLDLKHLFNKDAREDFTEAVAAGESPQPTNEVEDPFADDQALIDELFSNLDETEETGATEVNAPAFTAEPVATGPGRLANPFETAAVNPSARTAMADQTGYVPQEITVIIDGNHPQSTKQVIVIPRPSPWLMELLTGNGAAPQDEIVTAHNADFTAISSRHRTQRVANRTARATNAALLPVAH